MTSIKPAWMATTPHLRGRSCMRLIGLLATIVIVSYTILNIYSPQEAHRAVGSLSNFTIPDSLKPTSWRRPIPSSSNTDTANPPSTDIEGPNLLLNQTNAELIEPQDPEGGNEAGDESKHDPESDIELYPAMNYDDGMKYRSDIGKVTIVFGGENPTYERAVRTHEVHNEKYGYPMFVLRHGILDDVWTKPAHILSILLKELSKPEERRLKWLLWFDADTVIMNPEIPISIFLPPADLDATHFSNLHILVTNDMNGLNNGVFPIRVSPWSVELMSAVVAFQTYRPDVHLGFRDQSALDFMLKEPKFRDGVAYLPQRWFNAYQGELNETLGPFQMRRGDFLVHFAGVVNRDERMRLWMERAEQHLPEWEIDLIHTSYPSECREYWEGKKEEIEGKQTALREKVEEAEKLLAHTESLMREFGHTLSGQERENIGTRIARLRDTLSQNRDDETALDGGIGELRMVSNPLRRMEESARKQAVKAVHDAVFNAESLIVNLVNATDGATAHYSEKVKEIERIVKQLREMVVNASDDREKMTRDAETLKMLTKELEDDVQREEDQKAAEFSVDLPPARPGHLHTASSDNAHGVDRASPSSSPSPFSPSGPDRTDVKIDNDNNGDKDDDRSSSTQPQPQPGPNVQPQPQPQPQLQPQPQPDNNSKDDHDDSQDSSDPGPKPDGFNSDGSPAGPPHLREKRLSSSPLRERRRQRSQ